MIPRRRGTWSCSTIITSSTSFACPLDRMAGAGESRRSRTSTDRSTCRCRDRASSVRAASSSNWDRTDDLESIDVPTLVIGATHDTMDPAHMEMVAGRIPHGRFLLCRNGSHMAMYDDQATYFRGLIDFIIDIDQWSPPRTSADAPILCPCGLPRIGSVTLRRGSSARSGGSASRHCSCWRPHRSRPSSA